MILTRVRGGTKRLRVRGDRRRCHMGESENGSALEW